MTRLIVKILGNALAVYLAAYFVPHFNFPTDWKMLLAAGLVLALFNAIVKPILKLISAPLLILTLGLFTLAINIFILWLMSLVLPELKIVGLGAYFWGAVIISLTNWVLGSLTKNETKTKDKIQNS